MTRAFTESAVEEGTEVLLAPHGALSKNAQHPEQAAAALPIERLRAFNQPTPKVAISRSPDTAARGALRISHPVVDFRPLLPQHANIGKQLTQDRTLLGGLPESFVTMELVKQAGWSVDPPALYHFRTHESDKVGLVLERRGGALVGIEVKSAATVAAEDFKGLRALAKVAGRRLRRGIVLYTGAEIVPFGAGLFALSMEALWHWREQRPKAKP